MVRRFAFAAALLVTLAVSAWPAAAQRPIRLDGMVQWIAGDKLMLITDAGPSVAVELRQVPQDQYQGLTQRDRVIVYGAVSQDNRRIYATAIVRDRSYDTRYNDSQSP